LNQLIVHLRATNIDTSCVDGSALQRAISKAASRSSHIKDMRPFHCYFEMIQKAFELFTAAAHEAGRRLHGDFAVRGQATPGLVEPVGANFDLARED
jgi:hypothetical protein